MNIVSFGGGTNSTAMIIGMYLHKIPIDLILFADTGGEQPAPPMSLSGCSMLGWTSTAYPKSHRYFIPTRTETG